MLETAKRSPRKRASKRVSAKRSREKLKRQERRHQAEVEAVKVRILRSLQPGVRVSRSEAIRKFGHHAYSALIELARSGEVVERLSVRNATYSLADPDDAPEDDDSDDTIVAPDDLAGSPRFYTWDLPTADEILDRFYQRGVQHAARAREMNDTVPLAA